MRLLAAKTWRYKKLVGCLLITSSLLIAMTASAIGTDTKKNKQQSEQKLSHVQQAIAKQESAIFQVNKDRDKLEKQLKNDDLAIAKVAKSINTTNKNLTLSQQKITSLAKQKHQLTQKKKSQELLLAQQLRTAYTAGQHDYLKLLLNQEQSEKIQRTISYYQYLNNARIKEIEQFKATLAELIQVTSAHQEEIELLQVLKGKQNQQRAQLSENKSKRHKTLKSLSKKLLSSKQQLAKLKAEESNLSLALKKLETLIQAEVNLAGLSQLKKKLSWPVKGRILHRFGTKKQGYLKWKGVLMAAPIGRQVQTIHNGTILFSDWLKGYGFVTVIDHGNGYMSLYGHNQTLLKSVGDRVETGEPIALIGQSGGQAQPGLYFEIRHLGKTVNPKLWCK
ncbi:MAG: peptidoglycan DD-metalloendopeptidase family protein [Colwellia sp.]